MFLGYIHSFRALAIFFIVAGHAIDAMLWSDNYPMSRALRIIFSNGSVMFVFIAGYLFQHLSKNHNNKKYYKNKLSNVITPYLLISLPAIAAFVFFTTREGMWNGFYDNPVWAQIGLFYLTGKHLAPLWFIPMICFFYIVAPLLIRLDKRSYFYYLLPVFIVISCFFERGMPYISFVHFFSAYVLGMYCSHYKETLNAKLSSNTALIVLFIGIVFFALAEFFFMKGTLTWVNYLQKISASLFYLGLFIRIGESLKSTLISTVATCSFGIFFVHSYVITGTKMVYAHLFGQLPDGNLLLYPLIILYALGISTLIVILIQRVFKERSRLIVGS